jgi:hypothetical protein
VKEGAVEREVVFVTHGQAPKALESRIGAFDDPAMLVAAQLPPVLRRLSALRAMRHDQATLILASFGFRSRLDFTCFGSEDRAAFISRLAPREAQGAEQFRCHHPASELLDNCRSPSRIAWTMDLEEFFTPGRLR